MHIETRHKHLSLIVPTQMLADPKISNRLAIGMGISFSDSEKRDVTKSSLTLLALPDKAQYSFSMMSFVGLPLVWGEGGVIGSLLEHLEGILVVIQEVMGK